MVRRITLIPGDGIGPSVTQSAVRVTEAAIAVTDREEIAWEIVQAGMTSYKNSGDELPVETLDSIHRNRIALKGPLGTPIGTGFVSVNVRLRKYFDLFVNFRPVNSVEGIKSRYEDVDLVVFRENVEDLYAGKETYTKKFNDGGLKVATIEASISEAGSLKFFEQVFSTARRLNRKKVTIGHKANIFKIFHGVFLEAGRYVAESYPDIECEDRIIDNLMMQLVMDPNKFDVIATTNLLGDMLSEVCAGLAGGLGVAAGANLGKVIAIFEAVHGSWPEAEGKDLANPVAVILSAALMLEHIGKKDTAKLVRKAVYAVIKDGSKVTRDINPVSGVGTIEMTDAIIAKIRVS